MSDEMPPPDQDDEDEPNDGPNDEPNDELNDEANDEHNDEPNNEPSDEPNDEMNDEMNEQPSDEPSDEPNDEPSNEMNDEPSNEMNDEPNDEPNDEMNEEPSDEPNDEPNDISASSQPPPSPPPTASTSITKSTTTVPSTSLLSDISTSSQNPFLTSASSRFRSALTRVQSSSWDVEAWQALVTESQILFRQLSQPAGSAAANLALSQKLNWIESVYGALLSIFPYSATHRVSVTEMLMHRSALEVELEGGMVLDGGEDSDLPEPVERKLAEEKMECLLKESLGVDLEEDTEEDSPLVLLGGMCTSSIDLWLLYIQKRIRDAERWGSKKSDPSQAAKSAREETLKAYETAVKCASFIPGAHVLWRRYLQFVRGWLDGTGTEINSTEHNLLKQSQMTTLRNIYQRIIGTPLHGLDEFWKEYTEFELSQSEQLGGVLVNEHSSRYQHAKNVFQERTSKGYTPDYMKMCARLPIPPTLYEDDATDADGGDTTNGLNALEEERQMIMKWRRRTAYERTNPERLTPSQLQVRVRQSYKEMACGLMRHPEIWAEWAMWEKTQDHGWERADAVLKLATGHLPDCVLLGMVRVELLEHLTDYKGRKGRVVAMECLEDFVERNPSIPLGFVLYQKMVRKYKGIHAARDVFRKARRALCGTHTNNDKDNDTPEDTKLDKPTTENKTKEEEDDVLTPTGTTEISPSTSDKPTSVQSILPPIKQSHIQTSTTLMTHHVYSAHATIEHRLNNLPQVARRTYELGIQKHPTFLSTPTYVLGYANLLLELTQIDELKELLLRSIAGCDEQNVDTRQLWNFLLRIECLFADKPSTATTTSNATIAQMELKRTKAILKDYEDKYTQAETENSIDGLPKHITAQLLNTDGYEQCHAVSNALPRFLERFEITGVFDDAGLTDITAAEAFTDPFGSVIPTDKNCPGGKSDVAFARRFHFQRRCHLFGGYRRSFQRMTPGAAAAVGPAAITSAGALDRSRARMQQQPMKGPSPILTPEWLKPLVDRLPPQHIPRRGFGVPPPQKPPPHMIEMVVSLLRTHTLPSKAEFLNSDPAKPNTGTIKKRKRAVGNQHDSSDEEDNAPRGVASSGIMADKAPSAGSYGNQFRARQRARQLAVQREPPPQVISSSS